MNVPAERERCSCVEKAANPEPPDPIILWTELYRDCKEKTMLDRIRIQDLETDEIRELLLEDGNGLDEQQAAALKQFVEDIGGMENALAALAMLDELEKAA